MAIVVVNTAKKKFFDADIDLLTDTLKVMLLTSTHTIDIDTQEFIDDVSANEVSGTGYTAGGGTLAGKTNVVNNTTDKTVFDATDVTFGTSTITARYLVIYKDTGTPATSSIIGQEDFSTDQSSTGGDFVIQWDANGILELT